MRERAIVREQQCAGRIGVEPADRHDAGIVLDEVDDGRAASRVAGGRHHAGRLVEQDVRERLLRHGPPVHLDDVVAGDERVELPWLAVHGHASGEDELVGLAPRCDSRPREVRVQPHGGIVAALVKLAPGWHRRRRHRRWRASLPGCTSRRTQSRRPVAAQPCGDERSSATSGRSCARAAATSFASTRPSGYER